MTAIQNTKVQTPRVKKVKKKDVSSNASYVAQRPVTFV